MLQWQHGHPLLFILCLVTLPRDSLFHCCTNISHLEESLSCVFVLLSFMGRPPDKDSSHCCENRSHVRGGITRYSKWVILEWMKVAGEAVQLLTGFLCKHEDSNYIPKLALNPGTVAWALFLETGRWKAMDCWFSLASQPSLIDKLWVKEESLSPRGRWWLRAMVFKIVLWPSHAQAHTQAHLCRNIHTHKYTHMTHTHTAWTIEQITEASFHPQRSL